MKHIVVLTGAGISAESGISTFRDSNGLWENHSIYEVATPEGWQKNPALVQSFYNQRRKQLFEVEPNSAHIALAELESKFKVTIITQNVDDLHERAGSTNVIHLHGELKKVRSSKYPELIYNCKDWEVKMGDFCEKGSQLRPHIVWFGEAVPMMDMAEELAASADIFIIIGTSLNVYPAAGLYHSVPSNCPIYLIDPNTIDGISIPNLTFIQAKATEGMEQLMLEIGNLY